MGSGIKPHTEAVLAVEPDTALPPHRELYLNLYFSLREATNWADAGHVVATGQLRLAPPRSIRQLLDDRSSRSLCHQPALPCASGTLTVAETSAGILHIATTDTPTCTTWGFDLVNGRLISWRRADDPLDVLHYPVTFAIYRALTNNDAGGDDPNGRPGSHGREWRDARVHLAENYRKPPPLDTEGASHGRPAWEIIRTSGGADNNNDNDDDDRNVVVQIRRASRIAPPVLGWGIDVITTYRFSARPEPMMRIHVRATASGPWVPPTIPRFGLAMGLRGCHSVKWFGRGPGESYRDKKESQLMGTYTRTVGKGLFTDYEVPQENGNRMDVRWVEFRGAEVGTGLTDDDRSGGQGKAFRLLRARFGDLEGASFSASRYTTQELDRARHPFELRALAREREETQGEETTWVNLDWVQHGLGTGSCGPETLPQYSLDQKDFEYEIILD